MKYLSIYRFVKHYISSVLGKLEGFLITPLVFPHRDWIRNYILNGSQDETVSSHLGRKIEKGTATLFDKKLCCLLSKLEYNHCYNSLGE